MSRTIATVMIALAFTLAAGGVQADGGPYPYITGLVQSGQDVHLTYVVVGDDTSHGHDLERRRRNSEHYIVVFEDRVFHAENAESSFTECWSGWSECPEEEEDDTDPETDTDTGTDPETDTDTETDPETDTDTGEPLSTCEQYPECCDDCDGDGTLECEGHCVTFYEHPVTDECVPPGDWIFYGGVGAAGASNGHEIEVEDTGDICLDCACRAAGGRGAGNAALLLLLMLAIGGVSLFASRR